MWASYKYENNQIGRLQVSLTKRKRRSDYHGTHKTYDMTNIRKRIHCDATDTLPFYKKIESLINRNRKKHPANAINVNQSNPDGHLSIKQPTLNHYPCPNHVCTAKRYKGICNVHAGECDKLMTVKRDYLPTFEEIIITLNGQSLY